MKLPGRGRAQGYVEAARRNPLSAADIGWILASAALVLFMTPGLALFYGGMTHTRHVLNMLMMSLSTIPIVTVMWVLVGGRSARRLDERHLRAHCNRCSTTAE